MIYVVPGTIYDDFSKELLSIMNVARLDWGARRLALISIAISFLEVVAFACVIVTLEAVS